MTAKDRDAMTIRCEACGGKGGHHSNFAGTKPASIYDDYGSGVWTSCDLCHGTGREPATTTPRTREKTP